jgi:O-antigen/teichoic acid export membrane protein
MLAATLNFVFNLILVPYMGITGAAFATMIANLSLFVLGTYYSVKYIKFDLGPQFIMKSILASIVMSLIILTWNPEGLPSILIVVGVCSVVYAAVLLAIKGITREEILFFRGLF